MDAEKAVAAPEPARRDQRRPPGDIPHLSGGQRASFISAIGRDFAWIDAVRSAATQGTNDIGARTTVEALRDARIALDIAITAAVAHSRTVYKSERARVTRLFVAGAR